MNYEDGIGGRNYESVLPWEVYRIHTLNTNRVENEGQIPRICHPNSTKQKTMGAKSPPKYNELDKSLGCLRSGLYITYNLSSRALPLTCMHVCLSVPIFKRRRLS